MSKTKPTEPAAGGAVGGAVSAGAVGAGVAAPWARAARGSGWRWAWQRAALGLLALALALGLGWLQPAATRWLDEGLRDALLRTLASAQPLAQVAVVDIDEAALAQLGSWPWPRTRLADLAEALLLEQQARAVALDVVLPHPADATDAAQAAADLRLATLAQHAPLVLAQVLDYVPRPQALDQGVLAGGWPVAAGRGGAGAGGEVAGAALQALPAQGYMGNHAGLAQARCVGNIGYVPDADGVLRHLPLLSVWQGQLYPTLALALLQCAAAAPPYLPHSPQGQWRLPYRSAPEAFMVVPAAQVLDGTLPAGTLEGRLVLVGSSALALGDLVRTPLQPLTAGVLVHAQATAALLALPPKPPPPERGGLWLALWCVATVALLLALLPRLPGWAAAAALLGLALGWLAVSLLGLQRYQHWSVSAPLWAYGWLLLTALPLQWWQSQRRVRSLRATLGHYVAPEVLAQLERHDLAAHSLQPQRCQITVLVADMAGYTRSTQALALEDAAALTKGFLACLTHPVLRSGATLDRYCGDGLVCFWGAPLPCPQQAEAALQAARQMVLALAQFNAARAAQGQEPVAMRIGVESGWALVGDLGTDFRSTYTAVGDCINFAARLEQAAGQFGVPVLLGPQVAQALGPQQVRALGRLRLRNTSTEVDVYTLKDAALGGQGAPDAVKAPMPAPPA